MPSKAVCAGQRAFACRVRPWRTSASRTVRAHNVHITRSLLGATEPKLDQLALRRGIPPHGSASGPLPAAPVSPTSTRTGVSCDLRDAGDPLPALKWVERSFAGPVAGRVGPRIARAGRASGAKGRVIRGLHGTAAASCHRRRELWRTGPAMPAAASVSLIPSRWRSFASPRWYRALDRRTARRPTPRWTRRRDSGGDRRRAGRRHPRGRAALRFRGHSEAGARPRVRPQRRSGARVRPDIRLRRSHGRFGSTMPPRMLPDPCGRVRP